MKENVRMGGVAFIEYAGWEAIHAHEVAASRTVSAGERIKGLYDDEPDDPYTAGQLALAWVLAKGIDIVLLLIIFEPMT